MSTITFGPHTFAILANTRTSLQNALSDQDATHVVKSYARDEFSGGEQITTNRGQDSDANVYGLLFRIDRDRTTPREAYLFEMNIETGEETSRYSQALTFDNWSESEWLPLYLLATPTEDSEPLQEWERALLASATPAGPTSLREAAAAANVGGTVQYHTVGGNPSTQWRVVELLNDGARIVSPELSDDDAILMDYTDARRWSVVQRADGTPEATPEEPTGTVLPRTADEAHRMLQVLKAAGYQQGDEETLFNDLRTLRAFLPGSKAEREGRELADRISLCPQYEAIVVPTLGWAPRLGAGYASELPRFEAEMAQCERRHGANGASRVIHEFAARYQRGGPVNQAIADHMQAHLEAHKIEAASEMLEAMGMDGVEAEREFCVDVRVTRTIEIEVSQTVSISVTARDEDSASEMVDQYCLADYVSDYDWEDENEGRHYASTRSHDIDDYDVVDVTES